MELSGGHYHVLARLKVAANTSDAVVATMYVKATRGGTEQTIASRDIRANEFNEAGKWQVFTLPVDINEDDTDIKIGVEFHSGITDLWCDWIRVQLAGLLHTGLFERGGIRDLDAIADGLFTADAAGRAKFAPGFVNNALIYPDIDASKITSGVFAEARIPHTFNNPLTLNANLNLADTAKIAWSDVEISRGGANLLKTPDALDIGSLRIGGTEVITSARTLKNVSADAGIITSGQFGTERIADNAITAAKIASNVDVSGKGFKAAWALDADKIDGHHAGTGADEVLVLDSNGLVPVGCIPGLDASKIISGVFDLARIPVLPTEKIGDEAITNPKLASGAVSYDKFNTELQRGFGRYWEAEDYDGTTGSDVTDSTAAGGKARKAASTDSDGSLVEVV